MFVWIIEGVGRIKRERVYSLGALAGSMFDFIGEEKLLVDKSSIISRVRGILFSRVLFLHEKDGKGRNCTFAIVTKGVGDLLSGGNERGQMLGDDI